MSDYIKTYKGTSKEMSCRGFQYEQGKEYETDEALACKCGFHGCERPLDVIKYYPPVSSRYFEAQQSGQMSRDSEDSKIASTKITLGAEIGIPGLVKAHIEYVKAHTNTEHTDPERATAGDSGAATAGDSGAATAGSYGAATAGDSGAATAGSYGAATAGDSGAATAGSYGAATSRGSVSVGTNGVGCVRGNGVKARGGLGAVLMIAIENDADYDIKEWKAFIVDGEIIKADTWYELKDGKLAEVEDDD